MSNTKYNGWTNYSTWRVKLEMVQDYDASWMLLDGTNEKEQTVHLARFLKDLSQETIIDESNPGIARDLALAFLRDVNWQEIAEAIIDDMKQ